MDDSLADNDNGHVALNAGDGALWSSVSGAHEILETGIAERSSEDPVLAFQRCHRLALLRLNESDPLGRVFAIDAGDPLGHPGSPRSRARSVHS